MRFPTPRQEQKAMGKLSTVIGSLVLTILLLSAQGCASGYEHEVKLIMSDQAAMRQKLHSMSGSREERIRLHPSLPEFHSIARRVDSLLLEGPSIRYWNDSLARLDSSHYAFLLGLRSSTLYYERDTVEAVFAMIEKIPWLGTHSPLGKAQFWRFLAEDAGQALMISQSPNMARLTYDAFVQAERFAKQYEDDPTFYPYVLETKREFQRNLLTMPDSVRLAYRPSHQPSGRSLRLHAIIVAFIVLGGSVGGFHLWRRHKRRLSGRCKPQAVLTIAA